MPPRAKSVAIFLAAALLTSTTWLFIVPAIFGKSEQQPLIVRDFSQRAEVGDTPSTTLPKACADHLAAIRYGGESNWQHYCCYDGRGYALQSLAGYQEDILVSEQYPNCLPVSTPTTEPAIRVNLG